MAAATITTAPLPAGTLAEEMVQLTVTNGETYVSKLGTVYGVWCTWAENLSQTGGAAGTAYPIDVSVSGRTITFRCNGVTDKLMNVLIKGRL